MVDFIPESKKVFEVAGQALEAKKDSYVAVADYLAALPDDTLELIYRDIRSDMLTICRATTKEHKISQIIGMVCHGHCFYL